MLSSPLQSGTGGPGTGHEVPFQGLHDSPLLLLWTGRGPSARKEEQPTIHLSGGWYAKWGSLHVAKLVYTKFETIFYISSCLHESSTHHVCCYGQAVGREYGLCQSIQFWGMEWKPDRVKGARWNEGTLKGSCLASWGEAPGEKGSGRVWKLRVGACNMGESLGAG